MMQRRRFAVSLIGAALLVGSLLPVTAAEPQLPPIHDTATAAAQAKKPARPPAAALPAHATVQTAIAVHKRTHARRHVIRIAGASWLPGLCCRLAYAFPLVLGVGF